MKKIEKLALNIAGQEHQTKEHLLVVKTNPGPLVCDYDLRMTFTGCGDDSKIEELGEAYLVSKHSLLFQQCLTMDYLRLVSKMSLRQCELELLLENMYKYAISHGERVA